MVCVVSQELWHWFRGDIAAVAQLLPVFGWNSCGFFSWNAWSSDLEMLRSFPMASELCAALGQVVMQVQLNSTSSSALCALNIAEVSLGT